MKGSIIATGLNYPLQITTRGEQVIVDVQEMYFDSGVPVLSGTSQLTKRRRKFSAITITHLRDMRTGETSVNAQSFLQALGKRLADEGEAAVPAVVAGSAPDSPAPAHVVDWARGRRPTSPCYNCRRSIPRDELVRQRVLRGNRGRRHAGYVLMCQECATQQHSDNKTVAIIVLAIMVLGMIVLAGFGVPLDKPLFKNGVWIGGSQD